MKTLSALKAAGLDTEARQLAAVSGDGKAREEYARQTFLAHTCHIPSGKLRFLQYVDGKTEDWWSGQREQGAVLLRKTAKAQVLTAPASVYRPDLSHTPCHPGSFMPAVFVGWQSCCRRSETGRSTSSFQTRNGNVVRPAADQHGD